MVVLAGGCVVVGVGYDAVGEDGGVEFDGFYAGLGCDKYHCVLEEVRWIQGNGSIRGGWATHLLRSSRTRGLG